MPSAALCTKERSWRGEGTDDEDAAVEEAGADDAELELSTWLEADDGKKEVERTNLSAKSASIFSESGTWTGQVGEVEKGGAELQWVKATGVGEGKAPGCRSSKILCEFLLYTASRHALLPSFHPFVGLRGSSMGRYLPTYSFWGGGQSESMSLPAIMIPLVQGSSGMSGFGEKEGTFGRGGKL